MSSLIATLVEGTGLTDRDVRSIIANAPIRYKEYPIPKRRGGERWIAQPAKELKALQRVLLHRYLYDLPVHPSAMAYRKKHSIRDNALAHVENGPILKFDFAEFFPSIRPRDWDFYCDDRGLFKDDLDRYYIKQILFHRPKTSTFMRLAIGAPTSPHVSNLLMYKFDALVSELVQKDYVTYTRYADDLTFSAKRTGYLNRVEESVRRTLKNIPWPRLSLNEEKTVLATPRYHRQVTGLILSNDQTVSLGRDRKRKLSAAVHHATVGKLDIAQAAKLAGYLAFASSVEPDFIRRLERKYGREILDKLKAAPSSL